MMNQYTNSMFSVCYVEAHHIVFFGGLIHVIVMQIQRLRCCRKRIYIAKNCCVADSTCSARCFSSMAVKTSAGTGRLIKKP